MAVCLYRIGKAPLQPVMKECSKYSDVGTADALVGADLVKKGYKGLYCIHRLQGLRFSSLLFLGLIPGAFLFFRTCLFGLTLRLLLLFLRLFLLLSLSRIKAFLVCIIYGNRFELWRCLNILLHFAAVLDKSRRLPVTLPEGVQQVLFMGWIIQFLDRML